MKTLSEWNAWITVNRAGIFSPGDLDQEMLDAIQKDALSDPMSQTMDQQELDLANERVAKLQHELERITYNMGVYRDRWHEARRYLRAANKGAERNNHVMRLQAHTIQDLLSKTKMTNEPTLDQLAELVIQWGHDKGILASATPHDQYRKTLEEIKEIGDGLEAGDDEEILDGIGDSTVTLILLAKLKGWTLQECLNHSYNIIAKRTGKMVDGIFVKDTPPSDDDLGELDASKACRVGDDTCESCQ